jgi:carbon-monoxide dehydrogenase large subunit
MCAFVLGIPEHKLRVVAPDVGGGFGSKIFLYGEETALVWASKRSAARSSGPPSAARPSCPTRTAATMSPRPNWRWTRTATSWRCACKTTANLGAYLSTFASSVPTILYATLLAGQYKTPARSTRGEGGVHQHRAGGRLPRRRPPRGHLRGRAHRRDRGAGMGIDPAEIRRRNFIKTSSPTPRRWA